jgi:hypothetical protein
MTEPVTKPAVSDADASAVGSRPMFMQTNFGPISLQTNELTDRPVLSVRSSRPQTLQNHILERFALATSLESHPCAKQGEGSPGLALCVHLPGSGLGVG